MIDPFEPPKQETLVFVGVIKIAVERVIVVGVEFASEHKPLLTTALNWVVVVMFVAV